MADAKIVIDKGMKQITADEFSSAVVLLLIQGHFWV